MVMLLCSTRTGRRSTAASQLVVLDEEATLKRLYRSKGGLRLVAENPAFPDRNITRARLSSVRIAGVFVGLIRTR